MQRLATDQKKQKAKVKHHKQQLRGKTDKFSVHEVIKCCFFVFFLFVCLEKQSSLRIKSKMGNARYACFTIDHCTTDLLLFVKMKREFSEPRLFINATSLNR